MRIWGASNWFESLRANSSLIKRMYCQYVDEFVEIEMIHRPYPIICFIYISLISLMVAKRHRYNKHDLLIHQSQPLLQKMTSWWVCPLEFPPLDMRMFSFRSYSGSWTNASGSCKTHVLPANGFARKFECTNGRYANDSDLESDRARFELFLLNKTPNN